MARINMKAFELKGDLEELDSNMKILTLFILLIFSSLWMYKTDR